jgi:hypothetical protein
MTAGHFNHSLLFEETYNIYNDDEIHSFSEILNVEENTKSSHHTVLGGIEKNGVKKFNKGWFYEMNDNTDTLEMDFSHGVDKNTTLVTDYSLNRFSQIWKYFEEEREKQMNYTLIKTCIGEDRRVSLFGSVFKQPLSLRECLQSPDSLILVMGQLSYDSSNYTQIT